MKSFANFCCIYIFRSRWIKSMIVMYLLYLNQLFGFGVDQDTLDYCVLLYPPSSTSAWKFWWVFFRVGKNFSLIFLYYKKMCVLHSERIAISSSFRFSLGHYFIFLDRCTPLSIYFLEVNRVFFISTKVLYCYSYSNLYLYLQLSLYQLLKWLLQDV